MNPVLVAFGREAALVVASGVVVGGALYEQGSPLRIAITAGVVAMAAQVLKDALPVAAAAGAAQARADAPSTTPRPLR